LIHTHSIRLGSGEEVLVTRVAAQGKVGYGFSLALDATAARHMAERNAGMREGAAAEMPPEIQAAIGSIRWAGDGQ
jgi:hypothetical protein